MILRFLKGTSPGVIFMIAVIFALVWLSVIMHSAETEYSTISEPGMPLYTILTNVFLPGHLPSILLSATVSVLLLFLITNFNTTIFFINERTFLPALLFILFTGIFPEYQTLNPAIPASLLFMLGLKRIMAGYHKQGIAYNFFDAGILISTGSLFYASLIWFGVVILIGIILLRSVSVSELALMLLGLITPYLITFGLYYVLGYDMQTLASLIVENLFSDSGSYTFPRLTIVTLIFIAVILLIGLGNLIMLQNSKKIKSRKTFSLLMWVFVISVTMYFVLPSVSVEIIWITAIPASYILAHYFIFNKRKIVSEIFFSTVLLLVLLIQGIYLFVR